MNFGERVKLARELRELTQTELAERLDVSQSMIAYIENGRLALSDEMAEAVALKTHLPRSFFRQPPDDDFPLGSLLFRAHRSVTSRREKVAHRYAQLGYRLADKMLRRAKPFPLRLPNLDDRPEVAASATRAALGISPDKPITNLINTIERSGVLVLVLPIEVPEIDAFSAWAGPKSDRPVIIISKISDGARGRLSVAHELGHLVMHRQMRGDLSDIEKEAYEFASEFLMPEVAMREELVSPITLSSIAALKPRWGVSIQALIMHAAALGMVTTRQKKYLFQQLSRLGWRTREPENLDVPVERPRALRELAELLYQKPINYEKLAADVNLTSSLVREFIEAQPLSGSLGSGRVVQFERHRTA